MFILNLAPPHVPGQRSTMTGHVVALKYRRHTPATMFCWLVGCFGFNGPLRQYFSLYRAVSQREGERGEKG